MPQVHSELETFPSQGSQVSGQRSLSMGISISNYIQEDIYFLNL